MTSSPEDARTLRAIEVMTAWAAGAGGGGATFALSRIKQMLDDEGEEVLAELTTGLVNLAGKLLLMLERDNGVPPEVTLRAIALPIQGRDT